MATVEGFRGRGERVGLLARRARLSIFLALVMALVMTVVGVVPASAGSNVWSRAGLEGVAPSAIAVAPTNPNLLIAASGELAKDTEPGRVHFYLSTNKGKTWTTVTPAITFGVVAGWSNTTVKFLSFDPKDPRIVYANVVSSGFEGDLNKGSGLYRSADGGKTWRLVYEGNVVNLAIPASDPQTLYLAASKGIEPGCYRDDCPTPAAGEGPEVAKSTDRGVTWKRVVSTQAGQYVAVDPTNPSNVFVGGYSPSDLHLLHLSSDGGRTWSAHRSVDGWVAHPVYDRSGSTLFAAFTSQGCADDARTGCEVGIVTSENDGANFEKGYTIGNPAVGVEIVSVVPDPLDGSALFAIVSNAPTADERYSVRRSTDGGSTFARLAAEVQGLGGNGSLALDTANPQTLYASTSDGIWAYTFPKVVAPTATPTKKATSTPTTAPTKTAMPVPSATPLPPTATAVPAAPTPSSTTAPTKTAAPTSTKAPAVVATPTSTITPTPTPPDQTGALGQGLVIVGVGAGLLAAGTVIGRRMSRR